MVWKAGDSVSIPVNFTDQFGRAQTYGNLSGATAAGWAFSFYQAGAVMSVQPTITLTANALGLPGDHWLAFTLPYGADTLVITGQANWLSNPQKLLLIVGNNDVDQLAATIALSQGTLVNQNRATTYQFTMIDQDTFTRSLAVPLAALADFGYSTLADLSGGAWTATFQGRLQSNPPPGAADWTGVAQITNKTTPTVQISIPAGTTGCTANPAGASTTVFLIDVQLDGPITLACTGSSSGSKTFNVASTTATPTLFSAGSTFTVTGSAGNNGSYVVASVVYGSVTTVITVVGTVATNTGDGNINAIQRISPIYGSVTVNRQQTTLA